jgi:hypothetical protein
VSLGWALNPIVHWTSQFPQRCTTRIMFKHPEPFLSVASGGSGDGPEKRIQENDGYESDTLRFLPPGYNIWFWPNNTRVSATKLIDPATTVFSTVVRPGLDRNRRLLSIEMHATFVQARFVAFLRIA